MQAKYQDKAMDFYNQLESTLVNGDIPLKYLKKKTQPVKKLEEYCDKKFKADYLALQIKYVDELKYTSLKLKSYAQSERLNHLTKRLAELNVFLDDRVRQQIAGIQTAERFKYFGLVLPF